MFNFGRLVNERLSMKKKAIRIAAYTFAGLVVLIILAFALRTPIFKMVMNKVKTKFETRYGAQLIVDNARLSGIASVKFDKLAIVPAWGDTLVNITDMKVSINPLKLLAARLSLTSFEAQNIKFNFQRADTLNNYMFLLQPKQVEGTVADTIEHEVDLNYNQRVSWLVKAVFDIVPPDVNIASFQLSSVNNNHLFKVSIAPLQLVDGEINVSALVDEDNAQRHLDFKGNINDWDKSAAISVFSPDGKAYIPYINYRFNAKVAFDTLQFSLKNCRWSGDEYTLEGVAAFSGLEVNHPKVSQSNVLFGKGSVAYKLNTGSNSVEVDSATQVTFNKLQFNPYLKLQRDSSWRMIFKINKDHFPAQDLFGSLPDGIFNTLHGIETEGFLNYYIIFDVDFANPENLVFDQRLKGDHFRINHYGAVNYAHINGPFMHTAYERGVPVRTFQVGESNPNYRSLAQIPDVLKNAVMTSEDGAFYGHRGFLIDAFRKSIAENIRKKRFARGGSTITMQLVKNVFLTRNKTVSRKVEEALIVWMIENNGICSKDRMLEVYLNIIEWGPLVYGANEASEFYFNKDVSKLTLSEAIYLASIVPRPKAFKYSFDGSGNLREYLKGYYDLLARKMLGQNRITQEQVDQIVPNVLLTGPAKNFLVKTDSIAVDSILFQTPDVEFISTDEVQ